MIEAPGIAVHDVPMTTASLRYFDVQGEFVAALRPALDGELPGALRAVSRSIGATRAELLLAWRSPTETLLLSREPACISAVEAATAGRGDGCLVDQTGGQVVLLMTGAHTANLMARVGSPESLPPLGEARTSRLADVPVLTLSVRSGDYLLVVERVYRAHLVEWLRITVADF